MAFEPNIQKSVRLALQTMAAVPPLPMAGDNEAAGKTQMKKPYAYPNEHECPACSGTGFPAVAQLRPGFRIYPVQCKECLGKGRISDRGN
jgi:hypothetical protein